MKKLIYILSAFILAASCSVLDFDESSSQYSREDMYKTYSNIQKMLTNIYGYMPNKDIADLLNIREDSVKKHAYAIYSKIGAANRTEAATIAMRKHLLKF